MPVDEAKILATPKIDAACIRWLWANDWYDYILSGVCEYQGKRYYGQYFDEDGKRNRRFALIDLPEEKWKEENERHQFFVEKVGSHFDFTEDENNHRVGHSGLKPAHSHHEFYDRYPPRQERDYFQFPVVGWFEG